MDPAQPKFPTTVSAAGGSEMRRRIAEFDWAKTPLGPRDSWPQSLRVALSICLDSSCPIVLYWGPEFVVLYNDACSGFAGERHPGVLGLPAREAWSDIWGILSPDFKQAYSGTEAVLRQDQLLPVSRHGYTEECYFNYTLSSIRGGGEGSPVEGLFGTIVETTGRVTGDRRLRTLHDLAVSPVEAVQSIEQACERAALVLAGNPLDLPLVLLYLLDEEKRQATLAGTAGVKPGLPLSPEVIDLDDADCPWPFAQVLQSQQSIDTSDLSQRFGPLVPGPWPEPVEQAVVLPIAKPGQSALAGFAVIGVSPRLILSEGYRGFFDLVAGQIATSIASVRSFEEERRRADALAELDRAKTNFFNNISHEFRTPLTLMLSPLEDLLARPRSELRADNRELLTVVNRNGRRLLRLVNTLLDFSRIEAGRSLAIYQPTALAAYTRDLCSAFRSACERAGLRLVVECPTLAEPVYVDREMWEKIVLNLLSNAFKFTFEGAITVSLTQIDQSVCLRVSDMGTGIPAEEIPHLFERFHRIDNARGRTHEGSGIGLALVQELVKLHGGSITAESLVGKGSTFTVTLPLGSAHLPADRVRETLTAAAISAHPESFAEETLRWLPDDPLPAGGSRAEAAPEFEAGLAELTDDSDAEALPRVLIADDNTDLRQYLVRLLEDKHRVVAVTDGEQALAVARRWKPDLILADVMMPRLDGFALLRELRGDPATRSLPVIMLSARAGEESRVEGLEAGADDYLVKPFSARELLARVGATLQLARLRQEANEILRKGEERLQMALRAARMVAWEWHLADDTIKVSKNVAEVFGLPAGSTVESCEQWFEMVHGKDPDQHQAIVKSTVQGRGSYLRHFRMTRGDDGATIWLEERGDAVRNELGDVVRLVGVVIDITERKHIEEALQQSHAQFESLVNCAPMGIYLVDSELRVRQVNPKARPFFGDFDDVLDGDFVEMMHALWAEDYANEIVELFRYTLQTGEPCFVPERMEQRLDRQVLDYYEWQIYRVSLPDGQYGVVCYFSDVAGHTLARQAMAESDRRKAEFP